MLILAGVGLVLVVLVLHFAKKGRSQQQPLSALSPSAVAPNHQPLAAYAATIQPGPRPQPVLAASRSAQVVAGRAVHDPFVYFAPAHPYGEASAIDPNLAVGSAAHAENLPYWPRYAAASPHQRARYLDWLAGGKCDPLIPVGYVFIYLYGIERALLVDAIAPGPCILEVERLLEIYGPGSRSFLGYCRNLLAFTRGRQISSSTQAELLAWVRPLSGTEQALDAMLAWHHDGQRPLSAEAAHLATSALDEAKQSVVLQRAADEHLALFKVRYAEKYPEGIRLVAAKRPRALSYQAASPSLVNTEIAYAVSNVRGRRAQFKPLVAIWNDCIDDLRRLSRKRAGEGSELTADMWEALPSELRTQTDHPDIDRWVAVVNAGQLVNGFRILDHGTLAPLVGHEGTARITPARARKLAARAELVGYNLEPDARLVSKGAALEHPIIVWPHRGDTAVDADTYVACRNLLTLLLQVAWADGSADEEEIDMVEKLLDMTFSLDDVMRDRLSALREILLRLPPRGGGIAKKLRGSRTPAEVEAVGRMLVEIAAVDGILDTGEHKALKSLFRALGLSVNTLDAALASTGLHVESAAVEQVRGRLSEGEPLPSPPTIAARAQRVRLDPEKLARLQVETAEVAKILSEVLDTDEDDEPSDSAASVTARPPGQRPNGNSTTAALSGLDRRYHSVVELLCGRPSWSPTEAVALIKEQRIMPAGFVETVNEWAEDSHGDLLIEEGDIWDINQEVREAITS